MPVMQVCESKSGSHSYATLNKPAQDISFYKDRAGLISFSIGPICSISNKNILFHFLQKPTYQSLTKWHSSWHPYITNQSLYYGQCHFSQ